MNKWIRRAGVVAIPAVAMVVWFGLRPIQAQEMAQASQGELMQKKLEAAQALLEGLALEDFDFIVENAKTLQQVSMEAEWKLTPTKDYTQYAAKMREAAAQVEQKAAEHNLDAAAWNYMQVVVTCVECHKAVRGAETVEVAKLLFR